jgi:hypothetical protein
MKIVIVIIRKKKIMIRKYGPLLFAVLFIICATGCAVRRDIRLYDMESVTVITGQIKNARKTHGQFEMTNPTSGERFFGEYSSIPNDSTGLSFVTSRQAKAYGFSVNKPRTIFGQAILRGDSGTIMEIEYAVDRKSLHGYGLGQDNQGNRYKVQF